VGIRIVTFEACSGFTRVTAHRIAQPLKVTFVTRGKVSRDPANERHLPHLTVELLTTTMTGQQALSRPSRRRRER